MTSLPNDNFASACFNKDRAQDFLSCYWRVSFHHSHAGVIEGELGGKQTLRVEYRMLSTPFLSFPCVCGTHNPAFAILLYVAQSLLSWKVPVWWFIIDIIVYFLMSILLRNSLLESIDVDDSAKNLTSIRGHPIAAL